MLASLLRGAAHEAMASMNSPSLTFVGGGDNAALRSHWAETSEDLQDERGRFLKNPSTSLDAS